MLKSLNSRWSPTRQHEAFPDWSPFPSPLEHLPLYSTIRNSIQKVWFSPVTISVFQYCFRIKVPAVYVGGGGVTGELLFYLPPPTPTPPLASTAINTHARDLLLQCSKMQNVCAPNRMLISIPGDFQKGRKPHKKINVRFLPQTINSPFTKSSTLFYSSQQL